MLIDCKKIVKIKKENLKKKIEFLSEKPKLITILVGNNPASEIYVRNKSKVLEELGMINEVIRFDINITEEELIKYIEFLNSNIGVNGILVQLPLPEHINTAKVLAKIAVNKDVDGLTYENLGRIFKNEGGIMPCTPKGVLEILKGINFNVVGKKVLIIGRSNILGKPLAISLMNKSAVVMVYHSKGEEPLNKVIKNFNPSVIISCVGKKDLLTKAYINPKLEVLIDCAIVRDENNKICGDFRKDDYKYLDKKGIVYTSVPGGVGILTTTMVAENLIECYKLQGGKIL